MDDANFTKASGFRYPSYNGGQSSAGVASDKKSAEIRRNTLSKTPSKNPKQYAEIRRNTQAKTPIKNPKQKPQAKTLAPTAE